jgi:hypothetical protein
MKKHRPFFLLLTGIILFIGSLFFTYTYAVAQNPTPPKQPEHIQINNAESKEVCEKTGGEWIERAPNVPDDKKDRSIEAPPAIGLCKCPSDMRMGLGACYKPLEDELFDLHEIDESTCEAGDGEWVEPTVHSEEGGPQDVDMETETGQSYEGNNAPVEEPPADTPEDDDFNTGEPPSDLSGEGFCRCPRGQYWSKSASKCKQYEKDYLCRRTAGEWDDTDNTCNCLYEDSTWDSLEGCSPPQEKFEPPQLVDNSSQDNQDTDTEDDSSINEKKFGYIEIAIASGVALMVGGALAFGIKMLLDKNKSTPTKDKSPKSKQNNSVKSGTTSTQTQS